MSIKFYSHQENQYFSHPKGTLLEQILHQDDIVYTSILLGYPSTGWQTDTDIFQYLDPKLINDLRQTNIVLLVDYTYEGFSRYECPIVEILEKNALKYKINPKKIFYCSGNLKDHSMLINVLPIYVLDNSYNFRLNHEKIYNYSLKSAENSCKKRLNEKILLSLSRRNRSYRVLGHIMLCNSEIANSCLISQDKLDQYHLDDITREKIGINQKALDKFLKNLPLVADHDRFHINDPWNPLFKLHAKTLFSIVNETSHDDYNETNLFFSEKILKPIINYQPMIIWGQKNINKSLTELGFKTYDSYFDLDFDSEPDNISRYKKLLQSIIPLVNHLSTLTLEEKIAWRFKEKELLEYNHNVFCENYHSNKQKKLFLERLNELFRKN